MIHHCFHADGVNDHEDNGTKGRNKKERQLQRWHKNQFMNADLLPTIDGKIFSH